MTEFTPSEKKKPSSKRIGEIVAQDYRTAAIFEKYGIDFCCGGQTLLTTACQAKNFNFKSVQREIETVKKEPLERSQDYAAWSLSFLSDYIVNPNVA